MRLASLLLLTLIVGCSEGEMSVRQRFLAQSTVSVQLENWARAVNNQDIDSLALVFENTQELRVLSADGRILQGWEHVRAHYGELFGEAVMVNLVIDAIEIEVHSRDVVLATFRHSLDLEKNDGWREPTESGLGTTVWLNSGEEGSWRLHLLQLSTSQR